MEKFLRNKKYKTKMLCDDDDRNLQNIAGKPTGKNIMKNLETFVNLSGSLFFHYSGHGSYTYDISNDEKDHYDELIIASDLTEITDDTLNNYF
jgi:hypothetical protein